MGAAPELSLLRSDHLSADPRRRRVARPEELPCHGDRQLGCNGRLLRAGELPEWAYEDSREADEDAPFDLRRMAALYFPDLLRSFAEARLSA